MDLLKSLITVSEKAANIARKIRENDHLFSLLVEKKGDQESNPRFIDDFKTLADVLIQEMVRHDISEKFPSLKNKIRGEESNIFSNKLGRSIQVEIRGEEAETAALLQEVLDGDEEAAGLLASEAHKSLSLDDVKTSPLPSDDFFVDLDKCAVWIDPIDSTAEYISGVTKISDTGIAVAGLDCVTVLIGVYNIDTKEPVIGVLNKPFHDMWNGIWTGTCNWGVRTESSRISWKEYETSRTNLISLSSSEDSIIKDELEKGGFQLVEAAGSGYKIWTVLNGLADAYIISKASTYKWDTCGPHAILRSLGGDILDFNEAVAGKRVPVEYPSDMKDNSNRGGLLVYRNENVLTEILECLRTQF